MTHTFGRGGKKERERERERERTINYTNNNLQNIQDTVGDVMA